MGVIGNTQGRGVSGCYTEGVNACIQSIALGSRQLTTPVSSGPQFQCYGVAACVRGQGTQPIAVRPCVRLTAVYAVHGPGQRIAAVSVCQSCVGAAFGQSHLAGGLGTPQEHYLITGVRGATNECLKAVRHANAAYLILHSGDAAITGAIAQPQMIGRSMMDAPCTVDIGGLGCHIGVAGHSGICFR